MSNAWYVYDLQGVREKTDKAMGMPQQRLPHQACATHLTTFHALVATSLSMCEQRFLSKHYEFKIVLSRQPRHRHFNATHGEQLGDQLVAECTRRNVLLIKQPMKAFEIKSPGRFQYSVG